MQTRYYLNYLFVFRRRPFQLILLLSRSKHLFSALCFTFLFIFAWEVDAKTCSIPL